MRKVILTSLLLFLITFSAFAETYYGTDSLYIKGRIGYTISLVSEAAETAVNIDLSSSAVAPNDGVFGVLIGTWYVSTNTDELHSAKLKVSISDFSCGDTAVPYQIGIQYPYLSNASIQTNSCFITNTGNGTVAWNPTGSVDGLYTLPVGSSGTISTDPMNIYFRLYENPSVEGIYNGMLIFDLTIN